ncbi:MAG: hypothetical protein ACAH59_03655 [Pseudobdellovibrionaceae bacterium]
MLKVGALIKYLSENHRQPPPARLTFLNYLTNLVDSEAQVTPELLEIFFAHCLEYAHWQQNRKQLGQEIRDLLQDHMDLAGLKWPEETQILELESGSDFTDALQVYLNSTYKKGEKYRLIHEADKKILAIVLMPDHSICVRTFDRKMMIRHGQLEPLKKDFALYYTPDLELDPAHTQQLEVAPFVVAQFQNGSEGLKGSLVRGYLCQKSFDLQGENIAAYPKLFYAIKKMEKHFINRQTDPYYQQTISALEKTIENVRLGDPEAIQESIDVIAQAQNAIEYVFTGDKLLNLLLRDLQHTLAQRKNLENSRVEMTPRKVEESWTQRQRPSQPRPFPKRGPKYDLTN